MRRKGDELKQALAQRVTPAGLHLNRTICVRFAFRIRGYIDVKEKEKKTQASRYEAG